MNVGGQPLPERLGHEWHDGVRETQEPGIVLALLVGGEGGSPVRVLSANADQKSTSLVGLSHEPHIFKFLF